ncbi:MAG: 2,3-bisphosphoglycerate-independent phosphoglycerate mutase [Candidatus Moranbacteria bacterium GW2011_GWA2_39_41]|nr:MAG: 2,3-bisphosphoglycerate-independent phosphoglycerate mutase [Candidatus Moranbacteria bacterium GW2011_GWA2_39_41]
MYKPVILIILDGWGIGKTTKGNAIASATLPTIDKLNNFYPHTSLQASGISVGLPWGESGNSEVGHTTIGTGKIVYQSLPRIAMEIQNGNFYKHKSFLKSMSNANANAGALHLIGLVGKGAVHSHTDHLYALLELARDQKVKNVFIHIFTDGRDCAPDSAAHSIGELQKKLDTYGVGKIATLGGRYFGMDRNNNWDRVQKAYDAIVLGQGEQITDPIKYLKASYAKDIFDEYIEPAVITEKGVPIGNIQDNDSVIFFNFREDRARQITKAFVLPGFMKFKRKELKNIDFVTMTQYEEGLPVSIAFEQIKITNCLGKLISQANKTQLRISETEKFAHVTYFFNGGQEDAFPREDRIIIPSKNVTSFDLVPEMSAQEITDKVIEVVKKEQYDFILINYANADIVGHTGKEAAAIKAVEAIDNCLAKLIPVVLTKKGAILITADHGNAEEMTNNLNGTISTEHSTNPVPLWFITSENHKKKSPGEVNNASNNPQGLLSDIAPTILELMNIEKPDEITGESLLPLLQ